LSGAGLLARTFIGLVNVDLGIDPTNVVTMGMRLPDYKYASAAQQEAFYRELMRKIENLPGVIAAGADGGGGNVFFQPEGQPAAAPGQEPTADHKIITPGYLRAMGSRLVAGREFTDHDNQSATPVAMISETVARRYWPHSSPLGRHLSIVARVYSGKNSGLSQPLEIVGVVKDVRDQDLWTPEADIYVPFAQNPGPGIFLAVRTAVPPMSVMPAVREAVASIDTEQPLNRIRTMQDLISETYGALRFPMALLWIFSALALVLSAVGIFGVMSYTVSRRTQEMAIRIALGANPGEVVSLVLHEGLRVTLLGVVLGLVGALLVSRVMAGYVYGISATDPLTFAAASMLLTAVAMMASYLPARRAARVDPIVALRYE